MKAIFYLLAACLTWAEAAKRAELADEPEIAELADGGGNGRRHEYMACV